MKYFLSLSSKLLAITVLFSMSYLQAQVTESTAELMGIDVSGEQTESEKSNLLTFDNVIDSQKSAIDQQLINSGVSYQAEADSGSSVCDTGGTLTVKRYLRESIESFSRTCGWELIWKARRGSRSLDWKVAIPFTISYTSYKDGLEKILLPYKGALGADLFVDVLVTVVEVKEDRQ